MAGVIGYVSLGVMIFSLICVIVSVALDYWISISLEDAKGYLGLWKVCLELQGFKECRKFTDRLPAIIAVQAMVLLASVLDVCAILCGALKLFKMKENKALGYATAGLLLTAGIFLFVGFIVFKEKVCNRIHTNLLQLENPDWHVTLHAGFVLCVIAWIASLAGAVLFGLATVQDKD